MFNVREDNQHRAILMCGLCRHDSCDEKRGQIFGGKCRAELSVVVFLAVTVINLSRVVHSIIAEEQNACEVFTSVMFASYMVRPVQKLFDSVKIRYPYTILFYYLE